MLMLQIEAHNNSSRPPYRSEMTAKKAIRAVLAANLIALMSRRGWTQQQLESKSGISQRHISSLRRETADCTTEILDSLGAAFGIPGWLLLVPDMPIEVLDSPEVPLLVERYVRGAHGSRG
jgi:transcriptional regulator with XRE-family HTH domain